MEDLHSLSFWMYALVPLAYVLGSVPFGLVFARSFCGIDPRQEGSRNVGATNVARLCGFGWGVLTLLCDACKGLVSVYCAQWLGASVGVQSLVALAAVLGHAYSCFLGFKGGKAVATTIGVFVPLAFWQVVGAVVFCLLLIFASGFVSLGSLGLAVAMPILLAASQQWELLPFSCLVMLLILYKHRENIRRLWQGTEKSWRKSRK